MPDIDTANLISMSDAMLCADRAPTGPEVGYLLRRVIPALKELDASAAEIEAKAKEIRQLQVAVTGTRLAFDEGVVEYNKLRARCAAAEADMEEMVVCGRCNVCKHYEMPKCTVPSAGCAFKWRGQPDDATGGTEATDG